MDDPQLQNQINLALNKGYYYLKFRPRSEKELVDYLHKKAKQFSWPQEIIAAAIAVLKERGYINDENFVSWFVEARSKGKPKSMFALKQELQCFGIAKDILSVYFDENPLEEETLAREALIKRWKRYLVLDTKERFEKAANFLARRGFGFEIIKKVITELEE